MLRPRPSHASSTTAARSSLAAAAGPRIDLDYQTIHARGPSSAGTTVDELQDRLVAESSPLSPARETLKAKPPSTPALADGDSPRHRHEREVSDQRYASSPIDRADSRADDGGIVTADMPLTGDGRGRMPSGNTGTGPVRGAITEWWTGTGSPRGGEVGYLKSRGSVQLPRDAASTDPTPARLRRPATSDFSTPSRRPTTPNTSRFGFLSSPISALSKLTQTPGPIAGDDELLTLNVEAALFPAGLPDEKDVFSPAAFKNLQANALGLATRFQNAYRRRTQSQQLLDSEASAQKDELDEADTRAHLLRLQLEELARKAEERESIIQQLLEELTAEKKARAEERAARERAFAAHGPKSMSDDTALSEDLGVEADQRLKKWRKSIETDEESVEDASVFSRSRSPTIAPSVFDGSIADHPPPPPPKVMAIGPPRPRTSQQMSMFQKVFKGLAGETVREEDEGVVMGPGGRRGCMNCKGQDSGMAWNTVSLLRDENKGLKQRVGQLEAAVEGALDVVNGVGL